MPNFVFFAASVAELAHGEKSRTQSVYHTAYLRPSELKRLRFGITPTIEEDVLRRKAK